MDFVSIYAICDITSELVMFMFVLVMLILAYISKPMRTTTYRITMIGLNCSLVTIFFHLKLLDIVCSPDTFSRGKFLIIYFAYAYMYATMLSMIMFYIDMLSYKKRQNVNRLYVKLTILFWIYVALALYPALTDKLYYFNEDGSIMLTSWQNVIPLCGIIDAFFCLLSCIKNVKSLSRIVAIGTLTFIPMDIIALMVQCRYPGVSFISFTYAMPFAIFYLLFHSIKFDDVVGCQSFEALSSMIYRAIQYKRKFVIIRVSFPQLKSQEFSDLTRVIEDASSSYCRKIERLSLSGRIYLSSDYTFTMFSYAKNREVALELSKKISNILDVPVEIKGHNCKTLYKQMTIFSDDSFTKPEKYISMIGFINRRFKDTSESEIHVADENDYKKFAEYDEAQNIVLDVRAANNLDDERVVCFIQPIRNLKTDTFRSGEALMRMQNDGKMIFPDSFIPAAEKNNCIHTLTLIMVNRVCKKIKELEDKGYDFDGITVNCSTGELVDPDFSKEIIDIVSQNAIQPHHLRIEITESMAALDSAIVKENMQELIAYGIGFYLDDYGTGYSNLERMATYPFETIKFDKSILYSALKNPKTDNLLRLQLEYFKDNGFKTVVEGVEDEEQYNYSKEVGFDMIQGYYFSKPLPAENITEYFEIRQREAD